MKEDDDRRQMSAALSNRCELERYRELVNATDDDRVENATRVLGNSKSFEISDEKSTQDTSR